MIFRETINFSGSTIAQTLYTEHFTGFLQAIRYTPDATKPHSTDKAITFSRDPGSSNNSFLSKKVSDTTAMTWYPSASTADGLRGPVAFANDRIKINIAASSSSNQNAGELFFYIDGQPGMYGSSNA